MKKIKLIYNPYSGNKNFKFSLDTCIEKFQSAGYFVDIFRTSDYGDIQNHIAAVKEDNISYDAFVISGGDGSINILINSLMENGLNNVPIGIIPSGTANDFASFLKLPLDAGECCDVICANSAKPVDIGRINDKYFVNVCAGGMFSNISQNINVTF